MFLALLGAGSAILLMFVLAYMLPRNLGKNWQLFSIIVGGEVMTLGLLFLVLGVLQGATTQTALVGLFYGSQAAPLYSGALCALRMLAYLPLPQPRRFTAMCTVELLLAYGAHLIVGTPLYVVSIALFGYTAATLSISRAFSSSVSAEDPEHTPATH
jgi:hypothetical protein